MVSQGENPIQRAIDWFATQQWTAFPFQREAWEAFLAGHSGLVNAPTGSGKTYSLAIPILLEGLGQKTSKVRALWITPIRALSKEIHSAITEAAGGIGSSWKVGVRTGDTRTAEKIRQKEKPPAVLITTPESLHQLLSHKGYPDYFSELNAVVVDEWHELMGSKRGVQMELALSRLKSLRPGLKIWGISATIGNMGQSLEVLMGVGERTREYTVVRADIRKEVEIISVFPESVDMLPWAGHLGIRLLDKAIEVVRQSRSTLIFTNTRSFAEIWYQKMLDRAPDLSGQIAMHHGSISLNIRHWVEEQLHEGGLKAVICTSSLDLGVDFRPVEAIIQVGSPKGVARFLQRAGRSGHQPGAVSRIYFLPTHSLELIEAAAIRQAVRENVIEDRLPYLRSFDVLVQYLVTLATGEGFVASQILPEVRGTFCFQSITDDEWQWALNFITTGGESLTAYDEYRKVEVEQGIYRVTDRRVALRHRLSIGTIVSDSSMNVKYTSGKNLGSIEEYFIAQLNTGDVFWFAGRKLELVRVKDMEAFVRNTKKKSGRVPSWQGGRMALSAQLSDMIRRKVDAAARDGAKDEEMVFLKPLLKLQATLSHLPKANEFLVEYFETSEGHHVVMYPFEGRLVHEGLASLVAYRISRLLPITFSMAMNDYGFELLSDQPIPIEEALETNVLGEEELLRDIQASINSVEMARRKFRDIASIAGLLFKGYPGQRVRDRHIQSSSQLFFSVFHEYDSTNLLLLQAYEEMMDFQLEEARMRTALQRIRGQKIILRRPPRPTPFAFPIMIDRLSRDKLTSERLEDRVKKMSLEWALQPFEKPQGRRAR
jgi:ATP-dependent Lhr-like helicase